MYNNHRELMYIGLLFGVEFFIGALFREYTDLFVESSFISRKLAYLLGVFTVCVLVRVGLKMGLLSDIRIDFDEINFNSLLKWTFLCCLCTIMSFCFTMFLFSFSDSAWVVGSNVASENSTLLVSEKLIYLLASSIGAPVVEELMYRGVLIGMLKEFCDIKAAVIISSLIFGILHFTSISVIFNATIMGVAFSYMYIKTNNLAFSMMMHGILNCAVILKSFFGLL